MLLVMQTISREKILLKKLNRTLILIWLESSCLLFCFIDAGQAPNNTVDKKMHVRAIFRVWNTPSATILPKKSTDLYAIYYFPLVF